MVASDRDGNADAEPRTAGGDQLRAFMGWRFGLRSAAVAASSSAERD